MAPGFLHVLSPGCPPVAPDETLNVARRTVLGDVQEVGLVIRCCYPSHGPYLRVAHLPLPEGVADLGQVLQGTGDAHLLPGGYHVDADLPGEPVRGGLEHPPTGLTPVEFRDGPKQAVGGCVDVGAQLGNLLLEFVEGSSVDLAVVEIGTVCGSRRGGGIGVCHEALDRTNQSTDTFVSKYLCPVRERVLLVYTNSDTEFRTAKVSSASLAG